MRWQARSTHTLGRTGDAATRRMRRQLGWASLALSLGVATVCAHTLWRSREVAMAEADSKANNLSVLLDRNVSSVLERAGVVLGATAGLLERQIAAQGIEHQWVWNLADSGTTIVPEIAQIGVFDAQGQQVCGEPAARCLHMNVADRDYFRQLQARPETRPQLFGPYASRVDGRPTLVLARALRHADQRFAGVAIALIPLQQFESLLGAVDLGPDAAVALRRADLGVLVRVPRVPAAASAAAGPTTSDELKRAVGAAPAEGSLRGTSSLDGIERQVHYRRLREFPVYVVVGLSTHTFLAPWRLQAWGTLGFVLLFVGSSIVISRLLLAAMQDRQRIQELYDDAPCGYYSLNAQGILCRANATMLSWLGCTGDEVLGKRALPEFLGEHSRATFEQNFPHFKHDGHIEGVEFELHGRDGTVRHTVVSATALRDAQGQFLMSNSVMHDITELHAARQERKRFVDELEQRVEERTLQLRELAAELDAAESRERQQLARDLHDDLGQTLAAARIHLAALGRGLDGEARALAQRIDTLIERANLSTRSLAAQLAPPVLYELGLTEALEWLGDDIGKHFGLRVSVVDDGLPKPLSAESRSILYRATRELLINSAKHAHADAAEVEIERQDGQIVVRVADSGVGFDLALLTAAKGRGTGLLSVRERLAFIGGSVDIHSVPGDGAVITLTAPLSPTPPPAAPPPGPAVQEATS